MKGDRIQWFAVGDHPAVEAYPHKAMEPYHANLGWISHWNAFGDRLNSVPHDPVGVMVRPGDWIEDNGDGTYRVIESTVAAMERTKP